MPVFISYSHENSEIVDRIARQLVDTNVHVWFDKWELRPGDSLIAKIQDAIGEADCLCVVLSPKAIESAWFKKELNAGLIRELEEKRVIIIPILIEDCTIPIFLREKMYADFRSDYDKGFSSLIEALAPIINESAGRVESPQYVTDFAWGHGELEGQFILQVEAISFARDQAFSIYTHVQMLANDEGTRRWNLYRSEGIGWLYTHKPIALMQELHENEHPKLSLEAGKPEIVTFRIGDTDIHYDVSVRSRWLGTDDGKNKLFPFCQVFENMWRVIRKEGQKLRPEDDEALQRVLATPIQ